MLDLRAINRIAVIGGGTAGWLAALTFRRLFSPKVEIHVLEDPKQGIIGVGEGGLVNLVSTLRQNNIDLEEFYREAGASFKIGISYENWRSSDHKDIYYHLFPKKDDNVQELSFEAVGTNPLLVARIAALRNLHDFFPGFELIANNASQYEAAQKLHSGTTGLASSFHFDSHKLASFLKRKALERGIKNSQIKVHQFLLDETGKTYGLETDHGMMNVDFVIDASGMKRIGIGATYGQKWRSFSNQLILDRALPFPIMQPNKNPLLFTRSIAMKSGWMWQIPLRERTGAGYVFSSAHIDADEAVREAEAFLGYRVDPKGVIKFDPGNFERIWCHNVVALGLSAGFVEPLEATSIGQMLETLRNIERVINNCRGVIGQNIIDAFNHSNNQSWDEIRDFLRLHYDTTREDTAFWRDVQNLPRSLQYQEFVACASQRIPRMIDIEGYFGNGWLPIFHIVNWLLVAAPLGIVSPLAARAEIESLPEEFLTQYIRPYLIDLRKHAA